MSDLAFRFVVVEAKNTDTAEARAVSLVRDTEDDNTYAYSVTDLETGVLEIVTDTSWPGTSASSEHLRPILGTVKGIVDFINSHFAFKNEFYKDMEVYKIELERISHCMDLSTQGSVGDAIIAIYSNWEKLSDAYHKWCFGGPITNLKELYTRGKELFPCDIGRHGLNMDTGYDYEENNKVYLVACIREL